jgi:hypothetical protein
MGPHRGGEATWRWRSGVPRWRRCSGDLQWLQGGPAAPREEVDGECRLNLKGFWVVATLTREGERWRNFDELR